MPAELSIGLRRHARGALVGPPLTTARQPFAEVGRVAMPRFVRLVAGERLTSPRAALATSIVIRKSAAAR